MRYVHGLQRLQITILDVSALKVNIGMDQPVKYVLQDVNHVLVELPQNATVAHLATIGMARHVYYVI